MIMFAIVRGNDRFRMNVDQGLKEMVHAMGLSANQKSQE
jgi:hypothetical protein